MDKGLHGFFKDDGTSVNPDLAPKPALYVTCKYDGDLGQETLCILNRIGQQGAGDFKCTAYKPISKNIGK
jgi:hypothetical protein